MDFNLQKFIDSAEYISDIRNLDPINPVSMTLAHPVSGLAFVVVLSIPEPLSSIVPINGTWICFDSTSTMYRRAWRLDSNAPFGTLNNHWTELMTYDEIFVNAQYYAQTTGPMGPPGPAGLTGPSSVGARGLPGPAGSPGPQGAGGAQGPAGLTGPQGARGLTGATGPAGPQGITGAAGGIGVTGPQGIQGIQGAIGPQGVQGVAGPQGAIGPQGPMGPMAESSTPTFYRVDILSSAALIGSVMSISSLGTPTLSSCTSPQLAEFLGFAISNDGASVAIVRNGHISVFSNLIPGTVYYMGATPGTYTDKPPSTPGFINRPVLLADSATGGYILTDVRGYEVGDINSGVASGSASGGFGNPQQQLREKYGVLSGATLRALDTQYVNNTPDTIWVAVEIVFYTTGIIAISANVGDLKVNGTYHTSVQQVIKYTPSNATYNATTGGFAAANPQSVEEYVSLNFMVPPYSHYSIMHENIGATTYATSVLWAWNEITADLN